MRHFCTLLAFTVILSSCSSTIKPDTNGLHHRFWRGYPRADLKKADFETQINRDFFALYPAAVPQGLIAFHPVLSVRPTESDPAQWAFETYRNRQAYEKTDSETRWNFFDRKLSSSVEVEALRGDVLSNHAYNLRPDFSDYAQTKVVFVIYTDWTQKVVDEIRNNHGASRRTLKNIVFLITPRQIAEYLFFSADADPTPLLPTLNASQVIHLRVGEPGKDWIREGQGLKAQF